MNDDPRASEAERSASSVTWADAPITLAQATAFAAQVSAAPREQDGIVGDLLAFPTAIRVRGVFFDGLVKIVEAARGREATDRLRRDAGVPERLVAFSQYAHRDFYKLYYLGARLLHPGTPLPSALRRVARTFFPIFQGSLLGRTMSALMGDRPRTILPLLAKAYNVSVEGNEHLAELVGEREILWRCSVEPVAWYPETFAGIIEGTMEAHKAAGVKVEIVEQQRSKAVGRYAFRVTW